MRVRYPTQLYFTNRLREADRSRERAAQQEADKKARAEATSVVSTSGSTKRKRFPQAIRLTPPRRSMR